jgi:hypothetical protein
MKKCFLILLLLISTKGNAQQISVPVGYQAIAHAYGIPPKIFFSIAMVESRKKIYSTKVMPWPWTLNVEGKAYRYMNRKQAWVALNKFVAQEKIVDIGLMQVNWKYHKSKLRTTWEALDPFHNMRVSAQILQGCYAHKENWWACVGAYHSPGKTPAQKVRAENYRNRVKEQYKRIV